MIKTSKKILARNRKTAIIVALIVIILLIVTIFSYTGKAKPISAVINLKQLNSDLAKPKYDIALPKSKVSTDYYRTFDTLINELYLLETTNKENISPMIAAVKGKTDEERNNELGPLLMQIKQVNEIEKNREVIISVYLDSLNLSNSKITDEETRRLTTNFITAAQKLNNSYISYSSLLDRFTPNKVAWWSLEDVKKTMDNMAASNTELNSATKEILTFFWTTIKNDMKNLASSASSTVKVK